MKGILKYQDGGKTEKINKIQQELGLPQTGKWDSNTDKVYRQKMKETGLSNVDLANQIVNKPVNNQTPVIESFGKYKQCTAEGCAGFVTTKGAELLKIDRDKYSKETGSEGSDAWTRKPYLIDKGGVELDVNDYSKINVGDVIGLDRESYGSSIDSNWNKSRDKKSFPRTTENVHVGIVVGKTKDGVPVVEHYSAAKKMSYREPINNMKELGNYTTKWAVRPNINQKQQILGENKPLIDDRRLEVKTDNPVRKQYVQSINDNLPKFAEISGLSQDELLGLGKIATGILQRESESGETSTPLGLKETLANAAYTLGIKSTPASQGLTQIKPTVFQNRDNTFTFAGKYKPYFKIENLNNPADAANATMLNLIQNYKSIKSKYPNMTNEQLWSAVARSHKGLDKQGINNVLNYEDEYSGKALMDASDVTYKGDNLPTIERIRTLREAMKNNIPTENLLNEVVVTPNNVQQQIYIPALAKTFKQGGILKYKKGSIYIKPENRGKFTETKKRTGKTTEELTHSKNPVTRKRAIFAQNAKKWKHQTGGTFKPYQDMNKEKAYQLWKKTAPYNLYSTDDTNGYNLRGYWEDLGSPKSWKEGMVKNNLKREDDGFFHGSSVSSSTGEFLKPKNHPSVQLELDWYNSPDAKEFRSQNKIDSSGVVYKYVPIKKEQGGLLAFKKGGYLKDKNTYVTKDGKETKRGLWANVYLKNKNKS